MPNKDIKRNMSFNLSVLNQTTDNYYYTQPYYNVSGNQGIIQGQDNFYIYVYTGCIIACIILTTARSFLFYKVCINSSCALHKKMLHNILRAPMRFFDLSPSGRIINRFSKDMGTIDEFLPYYLLLSMQIYLVTIGILVGLIIIIPIIVIPIILIGVFVYFIFRAFLATVQKLKALEGIARSPVYSHISTTYFGIATIRSSNAELLVTTEFDHLQDQHTSTWYLYLVCSESFGFYMDIIVMLILVVVTFKFLVIKNENISSGYVGLAITQAEVLTSMLQIGIRFTTEFICEMVSVERVLQYINVDTEAPSDTIKNNLPTNWPSTGKISFKNTSLKYGPTESTVLKNLNITIDTGDKIGVVGRTGAGKTSLIAALYRLTPIDGSIIIDDIDIITLDLTYLRSHISIIPQEPLLFSATVRYNLDPFEKTDDETLWRILEKVELKDTITDLNQMVSEGGSNFSVGERQLICLARAMLIDNKILVMDEATANVDPQTDSLIQKTIRNNFKECTVLTIAHRLNTVMDSDKILVMDYGQVVEYDHAHTLLSNPEGYLTKMLKGTGEVLEEYLRKVAFQDFQRKHAEA